MTQVGVTIIEFPLFIDRYPQTGEVTIVSIVGGEINGITNKYLTSKCNRTGVPGKRAGIGRDTKLGVSKVCNPKCDHSNTGGQVKNSKKLNNSIHSTNRENRKVEKVGERVTSRVIKGPTDMA